MFVYLAGFAVSIGLLVVMPKVKSNQRQYIALIALMIPCLIAGFRANTIGTDVQVYVEPMFETAINSDSFRKFYTERFYQSAIGINTYAYNFEPAYVLLTYICAKFFRSMPLLLFTIQALIVVPIYKGLKAFEKTQPVWLGMAVFYFLSYNQSLNLMRQWIAMAFLLYGFRFLRERKSKNYFITVALAAMFHYSAIFGVIIFLIHRFMTGNSQKAKGRTVVLVIAGITALVFVSVIAEILSRLDIRYAGYITGELQFMPRQLLYRLPILLLVALRWKHIKERDEFAYFYLVMIVYDILTSQIIGVHRNSGRISLYFSEYYMLAYPAICAATSKRNNRLIMECAVLCYVLIYWLYTYALGGSSETVPYISSISW